MLDADPYVDQPYHVGFNVGGGELNQFGIPDQTMVHANAGIHLKKVYGLCLAFESAVGRSTIRV